MNVHGVLLAAGAGSRMGRPKALLHDPDGTSWLRRSAEVLRAGGCPEVTVVLGARYDEARALVPSEASVVRAEDWAEGMAASLRAALLSLEPTVAAALIHLVDLPDVGAEVVERLLHAPGLGPSVLARAVYEGRPGHPVLLGREHWPALIATLRGDTGARHYLDTHRAVAIECGDLAGGRDVDARPGPGSDPKSCHLR